MDTRQTELDNIARLLQTLGFELEKDQPHIGGERFLMAPNKLVLVGKNIESGQRVIIKISNLIKGQQEIRQEKRVKDVLSSLAFSKKAVFFPTEIFFGRRGGYLIMINEFIEQEQVFISYPLEKQYTLILQSFKKREAFHAVTFNKFQKASKTFQILRADEYLKNFTSYKTSIVRNYKKLGMKKTLEQALIILRENKPVIDKFSDHLVHGDFVPHNFRIRTNKLYILDSSAFHFGNKYEEWARLLNYMVIHNPALEKKLLKYVDLKKDHDHYLALKLMRIYKIGYLLQFYVQSLSKTSSDLHTLTTSRISFWETVLQCVIEDKTLTEKIRKNYIKNRDNLRSVEEINRQREFTIV